MESKMSGKQSEQSKQGGQIGFRITPEEKKAFEAVVQKQGKKSSEVLIAFVRDYIQRQSGNEPINEIEQMRTKIKQHEDRIAQLEQQSLGELTA
jgi:hypothetical protein